MSTNQPGLIQVQDYTSGEAMRAEGAARHRRLMGKPTRECRTKDTPRPHQPPQYIWTANRTKWSDMPPRVKAETLKHFFEEDDTFRSLAMRISKKIGCKVTTSMVAGVYDRSKSGCLSSLKFLKRNDEFRVEIPDGVQPLEQEMIRPFVEEMCRFYDVPLNVITGREHRAKKPTLLRYKMIWVIKHKTGRSNSSVGRTFGGRDHSTIRKALENIEYLIETKSPCVDDLQWWLRQ